MCPIFGMRVPKDMYVLLVCPFDSIPNPNGGGLEDTVTGLQLTSRCASFMRIACRISVRDSLHASARSL